MKQRIPNWESFDKLYEMPTAYGRPGGGAPKQRSVRSAKTILKDFQNSKYYTPEGIYDIEKWSKLYYIVVNKSSDDLADMFLTPGEYPYTRKGEDGLRNKLDAVWSEMQKIDKNLMKMYDEHAELMRIEAEEKKRIEQEKAHKAAIEQEQKKVKFLKKVKGLDLLYYFNSRHAWFVKINPWMTPKTNFKKTTAISADEMKKDKYYVVDAILYKGNNGEGLMWPSVIKYVNSEKSIPVISIGMYGPSIWTSVYLDEKEEEIKIKSCYDFDEWMKANINELKELKKKYDDLWEKHKDEAPAEFDPYWGMN